MILCYAQKIGDIYTMKGLSIMTLRTILFGTGLAAVLVAAPLALADNLDRNIRIKNRTSYTIVEFYASNKSRTTWEEDILGQDVIGAGSYMNINFDDGSGYCKFDFKISSVRISRSSSRSR